MSEEVENESKKTEKAPASKERRTKKEKPKRLTKVIIRRLPPTMDEETFLKQVDPLPDHEYFYFVAADWSLGHEATSRAYINLINQEDVFIFKDRFDGYVFVDTKGSEYAAVVEFAPFQGLPKSKSRKNDPKCNTIETDPHYIAFLENLNNEANESNKIENKLEFTLSQCKNDKKITSTPLLQYLATKKQERKDEQKRKMEEKRKQREEERQRRKNQLAKNMPKTIREEDKGGVTKEDDSKKKAKEKESFKDSRSRRRAEKAERDQKRKLEREKNQKAKHEKTDNMSGKGESIEDENDKRKEIKKYSETRREKRRSRNATKDTEQDQNNSETLPDSKVSKEEGALSENSADPTDNLSKNNTNSDELSETVKEFIKSVAKIREFVPRNRDNSGSQKDDEDEQDITAGLDQVKAKLEQLALRDDKIYNTDLEQSLFEQQDMAGDIETTTPSNERAGKGKDDKHFRRIRNKDRPSIEIYQPGRMRLNSKKEDDRSSAELRDYKSNPTSDCESIKKDKDEKTSVRRKVTRYSERRSSRTKENKSGENETKIDLPISELSNSETPAKVEEDTESTEIQKSDQN